MAEERDRIYTMYTPAMANERAQLPSEQREGSGDRWTMLVCSTCGGALRGRTCENGHNAYPAARIEVVPASALGALQAENERLREALERIGRASTHATTFDLAWIARSALTPPGPKEES